MFNGGHSIIYSKDPEADRGLFRDVLKLDPVDVGGGWLIFSLPPSEIAFHPSEESTTHEFYFMCDDVEAAKEHLSSHGVECSKTVDEGWGILSSFVLPGGGSVGFYQPRHKRP